MTVPCSIAFAGGSPWQRWRGKRRALYLRHEALVDEMARRGYRHTSPLDAILGTGASVQTDFVDTPSEQRCILRAKGCLCSGAGSIGAVGTDRPTVAKSPMVDGVRQPSTFSDEPPHGDGTA